MSESVMAESSPSPGSVGGLDVVPGGGGVPAQAAPDPSISTGGYRPDGEQIWYMVFIWCLGSSIVMYTMGAALAFFTLGKHKFGRYYSLLIFLMGFVIPLTLGAVSSACIAFVYKTSSFTMGTTHALMWGAGITVVHAAFGMTRIIATL